MSRAQRFGPAAETLMVTAADDHCENPFFLFGEWERATHAEADTGLRMSDAPPFGAASE